MESYESISAMFVPLLGSFWASKVEYKMDEAPKQNKRDISCVSIQMSRKMFITFSEIR